MLRFGKVLYQNRISSHVFNDIPMEALIDTQSFISELLSYDSNMTTESNLRQGRLYKK